MCDSLRRSFTRRQAVDPSSLQRLLPAGKGTQSRFPRQVRGGPEARFPKSKTTFPSQPQSPRSRKNLPPISAEIVPPRLGRFSQAPPRHPPPPPPFLAPYT